MRERETAHFSLRKGSDFIMAQKNKHKNYPLYEVEKYNDFRELLNGSAEKFGNKPAF